tara:strand:- start:64 stop:435 length:372 start_codon:yes stop_codon:yes gene_type:complete
VNKFYESVKEFQEAFGQTPSIHRRVKLIKEEYKELMEAIPLSLVFSYSSVEPMPSDKIKKEAGDLLYVVTGIFVDYGWDMDAIFDKVHESNMSKLGDDGKPIYREDGKVLKSSNYKEPDLSGL